MRRSNVSQNDKILTVSSDFGCSHSRLAHSTCVIKFEPFKADLAPRIPLVLVAMAAVCYVSKQFCGEEVQIVNTVTGKPFKSAI